MTIDIVGYLESQGIEYKESGENVGGNDVAIQCPFCDDPSTHLTIHKTKGVLHCWRCNFDDYKLKNPKGWAPNFKALIREIEQCSWETAKNRWEEIGGENYKVSIDVRERNKYCILPTEARLFSNPGLFFGARDFAYNYLFNRGFTRYHIDKYKLHFCPTGFYKDRIIIPVYKNGKLVNWIGRRYNPNVKFRYRNCNIEFCTVRFNEMLYGEEEWRGNVLRLVEGSFDKMRIGNTALAINRSTISNTQKQIIRRIGTNADYIAVILDPEAYSNAYKIAEDLSPFIPYIKIVQLPKGTDPAAIPLNQIIDIESSTKFINF